MAGNLVQVATSTVTSSTANVDLIGITTDDVYMVAFTNVKPVSDAVQLICRVTKSSDSSADTSANYDRAAKNLVTGTFSNESGANETFTYISGSQTGTGTGETNQGILYLYNFNDSSEYSFATIETVNRDAGAAHTYGMQGGWVNTVTQSCNGLSIYFSTGNIASGTFTLYKVI